LDDLRLRHADQANAIAVTRNRTRNRDEGAGLATRTVGATIPDRFAIAAEIRLGQIHEGSVTHIGTPFSTVTSPFYHDNQVLTVFCYGVTRTGSQFRETFHCYSDTSAKLQRPPDFDFCLIAIR
jgi:hypothetical protein